MKIMAAETHIPGWNRCYLRWLCCEHQQFPQYQRGIWQILLDCQLSPPEQSFSSFNSNCFESFHVLFKCFLVTSSLWPLFFYWKKYCPIPLHVFWLFWVSHCFFNSSNANAIEVVIISALYFSKQGCTSQTWLLIVKTTLKTASPNHVFFFSISLCLILTVLFFFYLRQQISIPCRQVMAPATSQSLWLHSTATTSGLRVTSLGEWPQYACHHLQKRSHLLQWNLTAVRPSTETLSAFRKSPVGRNVLAASSKEETRTSASECQLRLFWSRLSSSLVWEVEMCLMVSASYSCNYCFFFLIDASLFCRCSVLSAENCPDHNPSLRSWNPGHQPQEAVVVKPGQLFKLETSATLLSLTIQSGGNHINFHDFFRGV